MTEISDLFTDEIKPYPFQLEAIEQGFEQGALLIADDVGLGKTIESIGVILKAFEDDRIDSVIIIAPGSVKKQWETAITEANNYLEDVYYEIQIIEGSKKQRRKQYALGAKFIILHYNIIINDAEEITAWMKGQRVLVVADECTGEGGIKNRDTKTAETFKRIFGSAVYRLPLTATPIENSVADTFSIMEWVDPDVLGEYEDFAERFLKQVEIPLYFYGRKKCQVVKVDEDEGKCWIKLAGSVHAKKVPIKSVWKKIVKKITGAKNIDELGAALGKNYLRRTALQVDAQLPDVQSVIYRVQMSEEARQLYFEISERAADDSPMAKIVHLRRCCAAPGLVGGKGDDSGKIDELVRLLETELAGETVIIVTQWKTGYMDTLRKRLAKWKPLMMDGDTPNEERGRIQEAFAAGESKMLVMTEVGTRGLNLQVASVLVNLDMHFNPAKMWQRIGRIYRIGSKHKTVRVISFLMVDTIEERVYDTLSKKQDLFAALFDTDGRERLGKMVDTWTDEDWSDFI